MLSLVVLAAPAFAVDADVAEKANRYKGYDELISNITAVEYKNRTYYYVTYSKSLTYSGTLLLDDKAQPVTDLQTLRLFVIADMMHKNYPPEAADQWRGFSKYFGSMASAFRDLHLTTLSDDAGEVSGLLLASSDYMEACIMSFSPDDADSYLSTESKLLTKVDSAYQNSLNYSDSQASYVEDYRNSLTDLRTLLSENSAGLANAGDYMAGNMHSRLLSEEDRPFTETVLIALAALVIVFVLSIKFLFRR